MNWKALASTALGSASLVVLAASCGGDDGGATADNARRSFPAEQGQAVAHALVIDINDLPGGTKEWDLLSEDEFDDDEDFANTRACRAFEKAADESDTLSEKARTGRAERIFGREADTFDTEVTVKITIFRDVKSTQQVWKVAQKALESDDVETCFRDTLEEDAPEGAEYELEPVEPHTVAPERGQAKAFEVLVRADGEEATLRLEFYTWPWANAGINVSFEGAAEEITPALVRQVINRTLDRLEKGQ